MVQFDKIFAGQAALIISVSADRTKVDLRYPNGSTGFITSNDPLNVDVGQIILINGNEFQLGDLTHWTEPPRIGVVRHVLDERVLIEDGLNLQLVPHGPLGTPSIGQTVVFGDIGIRETLLETPLQPRSIGSEDVDPDKYLRKSADKILTFEDFGGYKDVVARARELIEIPLHRAEHLKSIGARPIRGVLFTGKPGTGKTHLARIIADQSDAAFYSVSGPEIVSKWVGDSEGNLRKLFSRAEKHKRAIVFFDEIDSIAERRTENSHESSKRVVAQLLTLMDGFKETNSNLVIIAATNRPTDIDAALRRPGRFDWEILFPMPTERDRFDILAVSMRHLSVARPHEMPLAEIATRTDGWPAAKLSSLWTEAALLAASDARGSLYAEDLLGAFERLASRQATVSGEEGQWQ